MFHRSHVVLLLPLTVFAAEKLTAPQLIEVAHKKPQDLAACLRDSLGDEAIKKGTAFAGEGPDFVWAFESGSRPALYVDGQDSGPMTRVENSSLWFYAGKLQTGAVHGFYYLVNGVRTGGSNDVAAYGQDSYAKSGVPQGTLSDKIAHTSKIYEGMQSNYWIYIPAQYDPKAPAALMVLARRTKPDQARRRIAHAHRGGQSDCGEEDSGNDPSVHRTWGDRRQEDAQRRIRYRVGPLPAFSAR
jgi:enterochelin esterase family protein